MSDESRSHPSSAEDASAEDASAEDASAEEAPAPSTGTAPGEVEAPPGGSPADEQGAADAVAETEAEETAEEEHGGEEAQEKQPKSSASTVASGIFASKITGLVRQTTYAYFFGVSAHSDVLQTAFRIPNMLQNLLGEGTLSAAFIPIYSRMIDEGREREAGRFAGAIFGLLLALVAVLSLAGVLLANPIVTALAPGFTDDAAKVASGALPVDRFALTVMTVKIIFPMTGVLVLSAWALGVLNSHRHFFVPYVAPALWNTAIIGTLFGTAYYLLGNPFSASTFQDQAQTSLLLAACFGALGGGVLQFLVQLPLVVKLTKGFQFSISTKVEGVREALSTSGPVILGRGVYQLSAYIDQFLASLAAAGAVSALSFAQVLYLLPISLFGLSVAASELPELSRLKESDPAPFLRRVNRSMRQMLLLIVPTVIGYLALGYLITGAFFQRGQFNPNNTWLVYLVLAGWTLGILATAVSRLLQNSFYALSDTKTPAVIAGLRIAVAAGVGYPMMKLLDQYSVQQVIPGFTSGGNPLYLGAMGLAIGATLGAWLEVGTLLVYLRRALGRLDLPWKRTLQMFGLAFVALVPAAGLWWLIAGWGPIYVRAALVVGLYGVGYLGLTWLLGFDELDSWMGRYLDTEDEG